jgi:hypothetical protein
MDASTGTDVATVTVEDTTGPPGVESAQAAAKSTTQTAIRPVI